MDDERHFAILKSKYQATKYENSSPSSLLYLILRKVDLGIEITEWLILKLLLPAPKGFGHPVEVNLREILNAIFYVQRTGCQWEMLPHDLPPYTTVYGYFQKWQRKGIWQKIHDQEGTQRHLSD